MAASRRYKEEYIMQTFTKVGLDALLTPENCALLLIDHQPFQLANVNSHDPTIVINNVTALARTAKTYGVPTILSTVNEERGGLIFKQIQAVFPDQKTINRTFINAWEDRRVVDALKRTGRKKLVIAALWTEMCLAMPAIHAMGDGYDVYVVTDASGGVSPEAHDMAIRRMVAAGAQPITWLGLAGELQRDWARTKHLGEVAQLFIDHAGATGSVFLWETQLLGASQGKGA
jgi:nicotinamidase-related amidase